MNKRSDLKTAQAGDLKTREEQAMSLIPAVDIYEDAQGITLIADLPGVSRERLTIEVDQDNLLIDGEAAIDMPESMEALYADVRATRFSRIFSLSRELQADKINAQMKDGVLTLKIPKRPELQPRKIEVTAG